MLITIDRLYKTRIITQTTGCTSGETDDRSFSLYFTNKANIDAKYNIDGKIYEANTKVVDCSSSSVSSENLTNRARQTGT